MNRRRATFTVTVDLDNRPGWGYQAEDFRQLILSYLDKTIPWYTPEVQITNNGETSPESLAALAVKNSGTDLLMDAITEYRHLFADEYGYFPGLKESRDMIFAAAGRPI